MFKTRVALLGALALLIVSGIAASTASAAGPYWHVNGSRLGQGKVRQIKLQLKGNAVLKSEVTGIGPVTITCTKGMSEGSTIEGQGQTQGQDKGRITFTSCTSTNCPPNEPIVTNQTKSHLVTYSGGQTKYADLFEPTQGNVFTLLKLGGVCAMSLNVTGSVAAEVLPAEVEGQEGLLNFPAEPIKTVFLEQQAKTIGLMLGTKEAKFGAGFGARLETNETYGVFGS